jgi:hypothetical protein
MHWTGRTIVDQFIRHLQSIVQVPEPVLRKIISELKEYYSLSANDYIRERHQELRRQGTLQNDQIYELIQEELGERRFPQELSLRQIRRVIYG